MEFGAFDPGGLPVAVHLSRFRGRGGVDELNIVIEPTDCEAVDVQLQWIEEACRAVLDCLGLDPGSAVFRRFFCGDISNQSAALRARPFSNPATADNPCAVSWVRQPPAAPARLALWAYHIDDPSKPLDKSLEGPTLTLHRGALAHHWTTGLTCLYGSSDHQTRGILEQYDAFLKSRGLSLADDVVRTWFFVRDIDANYQGLVVARREFFARHGLTAATHFIASSGIEGAHANPAATLTLDAYAISGLRSDQVAFLAAPDRLPPTHTYGVTFERATSIAYRDRKHILVSGTASIDRHGAVAHAGDLIRQIDRTLENMETLLGRADAGFKDLNVAVAYARNAADLPAVRRRLRERLGELPMPVVVAAVCRPGWLVEVEAIATIAAARPNLPPF
jgi:enamine deaminase RidA (YjgF/YER057c/UK114 family)